MRKTAVRCITEYSFGHPQMATGFGGVFVNLRKNEAIVDAGVVQTKLESGVTLITHDKSGAGSCLGFYADAGVKYDGITSQGATELMKYAFFSSNLAHSSFQIDRALRSLGISFGGVELNKKYVGAVTYGNRTVWRTAVEHLSAAFAVPRFPESDLTKWRDYADSVVNELRWQNPREYAINQLETVGYRGEPLGNTRLMHPLLNDSVSSQVLLDKFVTYFNPCRVKIVGVNIAHQDLLAELATQDFKLSSQAPHFERASPPIEAGSESQQYCGGGWDLIEYEDRRKAIGTKVYQAHETVVAVGWNTVGIESGIKDYAAALVYSQMMQLAVSSTVSEYRDTNGTRAFYRPFGTAGLMGYTLVTTPDKAVDEVKAALKAPPTDFVALLPLAKQRAASALFSQHLETDVDYANFLASSPYQADSLLKAIGELTANAVVPILDGMRTCKPCMYATGETAKLPSLRRILSS